MMNVGRRSWVLALLASFYGFSTGTRNAQDWKTPDRVRRNLEAQEEELFRCKVRNKSRSRNWKVTWVHFKNCRPWHRRNMGTVCASEYGGPSDPTSGTHGYHGDDLRGKMAFAELNMGTALGGLPYRSKLTITYGGRSVVAEKLDIGAGGAGCGGHPRSIDLWWETARALGFNGLAPVNVSSAGGASATPVAQLSPFEPPGGEGFLNIPGKIVEGGSELLQGGSGGILGFPKALVKIFELLASREGWIRIGKVLVGLLLLIIGVLGMANVQATKAVTQGASKAANVAALVPK